VKKNNVKKKYVKRKNNVKNKLKNPAAKKKNHAAIKTEKRDNLFHILLFFICSPNTILQIFIIMFPNLAKVVAATIK